MGLQLVTAGAMVEASPDDSFDAKARYLRALYRELAPRAEFTGQNKLVVDQAEQSEQMRRVTAEYERLIPAGEIELDQILATAWTEGRELAGQTYDHALQAWLNPDGSRA